MCIRDSTILFLKNGNVHKARARLFPNRSLVHGLVHHKAWSQDLGLVAHKASAQGHTPLKYLVWSGPRLWGPGRGARAAKTRAQGRTRHVTRPRTRLPEPGFSFGFCFQMKQLTNSLRTRPAHKTRAQDPRSRPAQGFGTRPRTRPCAQGRAS